MTISEALSELWEKIKECNLDIGGMDDEDLTIKALQLLRDNAELEFSELGEDEDGEPITFEEYYNGFHELKGKEAI